MFYYVPHLINTLGCENSLNEISLTQVEGAPSSSFGAPFLFSGHLNFVRVIK